MTVWDITGDDVVGWASRIDAAHRLPDLVRRLLHATAPLRAIEMRADGGTRLSGWDGTVVCRGEHPFCPDGPSAWELSVQADSTKLDSDYRKRSKESAQIDPRLATYVAISARRVPGKVEWEEGKRKDGTWKDVRLLDADDIANWLTTAPAVTRWFGLLLGRPAYDLLTLDELLDGWRARTRPPLPIELLVAGRSRARDAGTVCEWAERQEGRLSIVGDSPADAILFAAAALATDRRNESWRGRTVVVETREALRWVSRLQSAQPLIVLPHYPDFDVSHADVASGLVIPLGRPVRPRNAIELADPPYEVVREILERGGFQSVEAERLAAESGGKVTTLQRLCGYETLPQWTKARDRTELGILLLLGAWTPQNEADAAAARELGCDADRLERLCEELSSAPHPATVKDHDYWERASWHWLSEGEAWNDVAPLIPRTVLTKYTAFAASVLSEADPRFDLPAEQRFAAALHGKVLRHSKVLRNGVARAVARLAQSDEALEAIHGLSAGTHVAEAVVRRVLHASWITWASLGEVLPTLAEAAPVAFLEALEASLDSGDQGVAHTFEEEGPFGGPHVAILGALETLGWRADLLPRVALLLGRLAIADRHADAPGRVINRPIRSLSQFFHPILPATIASPQERLSALVSVVSAYPDVGFDVVLKLLESAHGGVVFPGHQPQIARWPRLSHDELMARGSLEAADSIAALVGLAIDMSCDNAGRWARVIGAVNSLDDDLEERALDRLASVLPSLSDDGDLVRAALRQGLHRDRWFKEKSPPLAPVRRALYERCTPEDPVRRFAWLFDQGVCLPDGDPEDWMATAERAADQRHAALATVWALAEPWPLLRRLASTVKQPWLLGDALARVSFAAAAESQVLDGGADAFPTAVRATYVAVRFVTGASAEWLDSVLKRLVLEQRVEDAFEIATRLPRTPTTWALFDAVGPVFAETYWKRVEQLFAQHLPIESVTGAIERLLAAGNVVAAVETASSVKDTIPIPVIIAVLRPLVGDELVRFLRRPVATYILEELLKRADRGGADPSALAVLELRFLPLFREGRYRAKHFTAAMASEPRHFVELVNALYRTDAEADDAERSADPESERRAGAAFHVLEAWNGHPGEGEPAEEGEERFFAWARAALEGVVASGRGGPGTREVARVLARASAHDGHWPCVAARRLLQEDAGVGLADRLCTAKYNLRGMTSRAVGEGGRLERQLATQYRESAAALREMWPAAARMLDRFGASYADSAARQDAAAKATRRREGLDIPQTSDELPPSLPMQTGTPASLTAASRMGPPEETE